MRKLALRGLLATALCAGLAITARAAGDGDEMGPPSVGITAWWSNLFGSKDKPVDKVEKKKPDKVDKPAVPTVAQRDAVLRREKKVCDRRLEVCDRLRLAAKNDEALQARINELEEEIYELYKQKTMDLGQSEIAAEPSSENEKAGGARSGNRNRSMGEDEQ